MSAAIVDGANQEVAGLMSGGCISQPNVNGRIRFSLSYFQQTFF